MSRIRIFLTNCIKNLRSSGRKGRDCTFAFATPQSASEALYRRVSVLNQCTKGCVMAIRRGLLWLWNGAACLLIGLAKFAAWCVTIGAGLCFGFVLAAQLTRWNEHGDWRPVPFADFLQILRIDLTPTGSGGIQAAGDAVLGLPATLVLFVAAMVAFAIKKSLDALETRRLRRESLVDHGDIISSIERALANSRKRESSPE